MTKLLDRIRKPENFLMLLAFSLLAVELSFFITTTSADTYWNLRAGQALWQGTFTFEEQWSFTARGEHWPDHEIAFQILLYGLWLLGGETWFAVSLFAVGITLVTFWLLLPPKNLVERFGGRFGLMSLLAVVVMGFVIGPWIAIRPVFMSFFFTALTIRLVLSNKPLWVPLVTLIWIQFHGSVIQGCIIMGVALIVNFIAWLRDKSNPVKLKTFKHFFIGTAAAGATLFMSPLGVEFVTYALFETSQFRNTYIQEWGNLTNNTEYFITGVTLLAVLIGLIAWRLRPFLRTWEGVTLVILAALFFLLSLDQLRVLGTFMLLATPLLMLGLGARRESPLGDRELPRLVALFAVPLILVGSISGVLYGIRVNAPAAHHNPFAGAVSEALHSEPCFGSTWNDYNSGGYLLWFEPDIKVAIDSRYDPYPMEIRIASDIYPSPEPNKTAAELLNEQLLKYEINCYLTMNRGIIDVLKERGLEPVAENFQAAVFVLENNRVPTRDDSN